jgi:hypothetical protein
MKKLLLILFLFAGNAVAGEATFTWLKPVPPWDVVVPPAWVIDEYRIKCTVVVPLQPDVSYTRVVPGYDTETVTYDDLPNGDTTCVMTSWSNGSGSESIDSASVNKFVFNADVNPNPPTIFDFVPLAALQGIKTAKFKSRTVITSANNKRHVVNCIFKTGKKGKRITACSKPKRL